MMMRRFVAACAICLLMAPCVEAAGTFSGLPAASEPLGNLPDAVPLDQGTGCPMSVQPCVTSQAPSLRLGQPFQATSPPNPPFLYQQWWDTNNPALPLLNLYDGSNWVALGNLDTVNHQWFSASGVLAMNRNASNANLPTALNNLGVGVSGQAIAQWTYGANGAPLPADPSFGYGGLTTTIYTTPGIGLTDAFSNAIQGNAHLSAGTRGIALGGLFQGYTDGTWGPGASPLVAGAVGLWSQGNGRRGGVVFGGEFDAHADTIAITSGVGIEIDMDIGVAVGAKYGLAINSDPGDTGAITGTITVANSGAVLPASAYFLFQAISATPTFEYGILTVQQPIGVGNPPLAATGALWRAGGFTLNKGLDWSDVVFTGYAIDVSGTIREDLAPLANSTTDILTMQNSSALDATTFRIVQNDYTRAPQTSINFVANGFTNLASYMSFNINPGGGIVEGMRLLGVAGTQLTDVRIGSGSAIAANSSGGFLLLPATAGMPNGTPANASAGAIPVVIDTTNHKICWYEPGPVWKCAAGT